MKFGKSLGVVFLVAAMSIMSLVGVANSQEFSEGHITAAKRAMSASRSTTRLDGILPQMAEQAKSELIRNRPDAEAQITDIVDTATLTFASRRGDLENEVAQIFARTFSEEELGQIAEFYESEAGRKFLTESPIVVREITNASRVWANGVQRDLSQMVGEKLTEAGLQ